jgi:hypothetical protein
MKKRLLFLFVLSVFLAGYGYAQTKTVTGKVTDAKDASPLSGATILSTAKLLELPVMMVVFCKTSYRCYQYYHIYAGLCG